MLLCLILTGAMGNSAFAEGNVKVVDSTYLDNWIGNYCTEHGLTDFSVGFYYTGTGEYWFYNADQFMYSASMYKVPCSMLLSEKEAAGELTQDSKVYGFTVEYLERTAIVDSNNDSGHHIADYMGEGISAYDTYNGKDADLIRKYAPSLEDSYFPDEYYNWSYYSARFITEVIKTLYEGGEEKYPHIIGYMKQAMPSNYFHLCQTGGYEIAQKYGDFTEGGGTGDQNHHCTGIIYTPTPIIVTVMSKNISYYEQRIAEVAKFLTDYSLKLDEKLLTATPEPEQTPVPATPEPAATENPVPASPEPVQTPDVPDVRNEKTGFPFYIVLIPLLLAGIIIPVVIKGRKTGKSTSNNKKKEKYTPKH